MILGDTGWKPVGWKPVGWKPARKIVATNLWNQRDGLHKNMCYGNF